MIPLSLRQFASAVGARPKWVLNAATRIGRPFEYTADDARWVRLARSLNHEMRIPLRTAAELAAQALKSQTRRAARATPAGPAAPAELARAAGPGGGAQEATCIVEVQAEGLRLTIDLERHRATFAAALAAAMAFEAPKRPGRKRPSPRNSGAAIARARRHGISIGMLRAKLRRPAEERLVRQAAPAGSARNVAGTPNAPNAPNASNVPDAYVPDAYVPDASDIAQILTCLRAHGVRAVVAGDVAEVVWGGELPTGPDPSPVREPLELCHDSSSENLERLAVALRELGARPRLDGASRVDLITLRSTPALALATRCGALDLRQHLPGLGDFTEAVRNSRVMSVLGITVPVLELPALRRARCTTGSRRDVERVLLLDAVLALPTLEARHREMALRRARWTAA